MEPVSWPIVVQAAEWLGGALKAARSKEQQRFARLVEHAGTVVAGLRALDREAHRLFLPLIYGDLRAWPESQRSAWAHDLVALAHEDRITPALRVSLAALNDLGPQQADQDARRLVENLTTLLESRPGASFYGPLGLFVQANVTGAFDYLIGSELDPILKALKNPDKSDLLAVRANATMFVYGVDREVRQFVRIRSADEAGARMEYFEGFPVRHRYHPILAGHEGKEPSQRHSPRDLETAPSMNPVTTLRPYADHAEGIFGQLLALQNRVFPSLPTPVWVWS
jgi:hypothetical protein